MLDRLGQETVFGKIECARNIFILDDNENLVWQVKSDFDIEDNPFTNIKYGQDGSLVTYRWDGGNYSIDADTGFASPIDNFIK